MAKKGLRNRDAVMRDCVGFILGRFEEMIMVYGPDFSFTLAKDLLWYLRLKNGMYIADTTEGRFISEIEALISEEKVSFTREEERYILSEVLLYITSRINSELKRVVDEEKTIDSDKIYRNNRVKLI